MMKSNQTLVAGAIKILEALGGREALMTEGARCFSAVFEGGGGAAFLVGIDRPMAIKILSQRNGRYTLKITQHANADDTEGFTVAHQADLRLSDLKNAMRRTTKP